MIIDCYEDIIKRYYKDLPVAFLESFREFLKVSLPNMKRKDDPRELAPGKSITYMSAEGDCVCQFERMAGMQYPVLVVKLVTPNGELNNEVLRVVVTPPMLKCYSTGAEGMIIGYMAGPAATNYPTQGEFRYYDAEAADYVLKGRDILSFDVEQEISDLSMKPDGEVRLEEKRDAKGHPIITTSTGEQIEFSGHTFMGCVAALDINEMCKQSSNTK